MGRCTDLVLRYAVAQSLFPGMEFINIGLVRMSMSSQRVEFTNRSTMWSIRRT